MKNKSLHITITVVAFLLLMLLVMQFTDAIQWSLFDFILAAAFLFTIGLTIDLIIKKVRRAKHRITLIAALLAILLLLWAEIGVGILGSVFSGN